MWKDYRVNRWKPLLTEHYDMYFYISDVTARKYWSTGFYPAMVEPDEYNVAFSPDKAEFRRLDGHIETKLQAAVSPQEDVEVRRITISNRSGHTARLDITSYFEPVIDSPELTWLILHSASFLFRLSITIKAMFCWHQEDPQNRGKNVYICLTA